ncbi:MAG: flagellar hook-basal body complex protein FliE [Planctomycetes bacterium]|nr:flagellar hook-basal body complex protein FliE [Planctomycetota bacterium]
MVDGISNPAGRLEQAWAAARAARANSGASGAPDVLREAHALQQEAVALARGAGDPRIGSDRRGQGTEAGLDDGSSVVSADRGFGSSLARGAADIADQVRRTDEIPAQLASGKGESIAELAAQVKSADLSFRFALEVRNKLIDAYREVMRMSV